MKHEPATDIVTLSVAERILLIEDIWDSITNIPDALPLTEAQKSELDKRLVSYRNNPSAGSPWQTVKKRLCRKHAV